MPNKEEARKSTELLELLADEFIETAAGAVEEAGEPAYRVDQLRRWLYERTPGAFDDMEGLPLSLRNHLANTFVLHPLDYDLDLLSEDGTRKFLWRRGGDDGEGRIESVLIPDGERVTYCISTQAGCPVKCTFCATGYGGFSGNLSTAEIIDQVVQIRMRTSLAPTNLVFMGMGEPLLNFDGLLRALSIMTDSRQLGFGSRRITVSTVGIPERIRQLSRAFPQVKLALSLHAVDQGLRDELVPLNLKYPLDEVLDAVREHCDATGKKVTFEYVILPGVNDSADDAKAVASKVRGIPASINLIGFNPFDEAPYRKPALKSMLVFRDELDGSFAGEVTLRRSRGEDIQGACGQLSLKNSPAT